MNETLSEAEMRRALFGNAVPSSQDHAEPHAVAKLSPAPTAARSKPLSSRLRVTLRVTKIFEGPEEVFVHDANTLSSLVAESEAKDEAKKKKFRYFELVSIQAVQV